MFSRMLHYIFVHQIRRRHQHYTVVAEGSNTRLIMNEMGNLLIGIALIMAPVIRARRVGLRDRTS